MGLVKKMEWLKWIRKYSTGILDSKTGSMETLIDSASSKTINYAYTSSVIADDELINAAAPPHQRPMLPPPPPTSQTSPSPPQQLSDVYDCCVSLDGIPIKHEFQYTFSDTDGHGKITKHDVEGLARKILESMYGTTSKFSSRGQRSVKVTLNIRQSMAVVVDSTTTGTPYRGHQSSRERKTKSSADRHRNKIDAAESGVFDDATLLEQSGYPLVYDGVKGSWLPHHRSSKLGAQRYRREQLIEMVQRSLAENLSFQNQRKSNKPEVVYHRPRTKRRQTAGALPAKVAWSPYDFEPVAHIPSHQHHHRLQQQQHHHRQYEHLKNVRSQQQQLYSNGATTEEYAVKYSSGHSRHHRGATAVVSGSNPQQSKDSAAAATATTAATTAAQEQTKNIDHQRYKRAKLASKKIHHHIHEHHHYHHYDYYIV
ncbi:protein naked cuticle homolog 1-like isoform X2 [Melanaphis sacchari]|uniref:protein naked cuticle homolog 1-like isoform X2 n=1 Tax=Melanaphis sacchari TaxID=742174 RepID=UPI000DC14250|nr:protein naked cuticle homolog 1-like isoform X2 [Melanaphis sacchari]